MKMQKFSIASILVIILFISILDARDNEKDSIEITGDITHVVQKGETLYGISRHFQVTVDGLLYANKFLAKDFIIHPGDQLLIPDEALVEKLAAIKPNCQVVKCKFHVVQQGETLYAISKKYPDLTVDKLIELNELSSEILQPGQEIIVQVLEEKLLKAKDIKVSNDHWTRAKERLSQEAVDQKDPNNVSEETENTPVTLKFNSVSDVIQHYKEIFDSYDTEALDQKKERCVANYLDEEMGSSSYFALYNDAAVGSVLKVRNLMNNNIVYLRVVGSVPELDHENSITLKISNPAAKKLNVLDEKFQAEVVSFAK